MHKLEYVKQIRLRILIGSVYLPVDNRGLISFAHCGSCASENADLGRSLCTSMVCF